MIRSAGFNWHQEAISAPAYRFDKAGLFSAVVESTAQLGNGRVEAVIEVNEDIGGPELGAEFFSRHHFVGTLQENDERLEGFFFERDP